MRSEIHDVHIGSEASVVGQIPAIVIGVLVDDDIVSIPVPSINEAKIDRRDAPVPSIEGEAIGASTAEVPSVRWSESAYEAAMFKGVVDMKVCIVATGVVTHPLISLINVRCVGMAWPVTEVARLR